MKRDIHTWFGLSYAEYLTIPRSVLQSMPREWQLKFVELLEELEETKWSDKLPEKSSYKVELREREYDCDDQFKWGKEINDPLADYQRGRRNVFKE